MQQKHIFVLLISLILSLTTAKWNGTTLLYSSSTKVPKVDAYFNPDTGVVHTLSFSAKLMIYKRLVAGKWSDAATLDSAHKGMGYLDILSTPYVDSTKKVVQHVVIMYDSSRGGDNMKACDEKDQTGCREIYLVESEDDGLTWGVPFAIPRSDMKDQVNRMKGSLTYDMTSKTIFVGYIVSDPRTGKMEVRMTLKTLPDTRFSNEEKLTIPGVGQPSHPKMGVTNTGRSGMGVLHMLFMKNFGKGLSHVAYSRSENLGLTWTAPVVFDKSIGEHVLTLHSLNRGRAAGVFASYSHSNATMISFVYSRDGGKTWTAPKEVRAGASLVPYVRACGQSRAEGFMLTIFGPTSQFYEIHYFNATDGRRTQYAVPFKERTRLENVPLCDCHSKTGHDLNFFVGGPSGNDALYDSWEQ